eukprot:TRINITY_DN8471_c0_g1_i2.p3 TRINITY_DN8471_c0_g1~~TRINITY_DN8471_c0_g1_i2.p3  ORF type:complete len:103 (+),score=16.36 TRINITY_DN8471_c0_g1_i2:579-887(+)
MAEGEGPPVFAPPVVTIELRGRSKRPFSATVPVGVTYADLRLAVRKAYKEEHGFNPPVSLVAVTELPGGGKDTTYLTREQTPSELAKVLVRPNTVFHCLIPL